MPADSAACACALVHTRTLAHAHEHDGTHGLSDMVPLRQTTLTDFLSFPVADKVPAQQDLAARNNSPLAAPRGRKASKLRYLRADSLTLTIRGALQDAQVAAQGRGGGRCGDAACGRGGLRHPGLSAPGQQDEQAALTC